MALYELRTYTLYVGKMAEATKLYQELGFPALKKGGHDKKLVGYFQADTGTINQVVHLWKFDDDADRRKRALERCKYRDYPLLRAHQNAALAATYRRWSAHLWLKRPPRPCFHPALA
jgi:hypothetical protein